MLNVIFSSAHSLRSIATRTRYLLFTKPTLTNNWPCKRLWFRDEFIQSIIEKKYLNLCQ
jgi:hypothetical protein